MQKVPLAPQLPIPHRPLRPPFPAGGRLPEVEEADPAPGAPPTRRRPPEKNGLPAHSTQENFQPERACRQRPFHRQLAARVPDGLQDGAGRGGPAEPQVPHRVAEGGAVGAGGGQEVPQERQDTQVVQGQGRKVRRPLPAAGPRHAAEEGARAGEEGDGEAENPPNEEEAGGERGTAPHLVLVSQAQDEEVLRGEQEQAGGGEEAQQVL